MSQPGQSFSPNDRPHVRRRPSPRNVPVTRAQLETGVIRRVLREMEQFLDEYEWTHDARYGSAGGGVGGGSSDLAYSNPVGAIALRGSNDIVREYGGAPVDGERDPRAMSRLSAVLLDSEQRLNRMERDLLSAIVHLRKAQGTGDPIQQPLPDKTAGGPRRIKEALDAQRRRAERGESTPTGSLPRGYQP